MKRLKNAFSPGARVCWMNAEMMVQGIVRKVFTHRVERTIKGATVVHAADRRNPAYLIEQADGDTLLKNHSELQPA